MIYNVYMKYFDWDPKKNSILIQQRGVSFERVVVAIESGDLLQVVTHSNQTRYPHQRLFVVLIEEYVYLIPFVEDDEKIFLKTIIPSRKATRHYRSTQETQ